MKITKNNLYDVIFENEDARLLILDVVSHTEADIYYYHDYEITLLTALYIWDRAMKAEENNSTYKLSYLDFLPNTELKEYLCG